VQHWEIHHPGQSLAEVKKTAPYNYELYKAAMG
jgi:hypothetical protein